MRFKFIICLLLITFSISAQTGRETKIDSLENLLSQNIQDTTRTIALAELARTYGGVDSAKCFINGFAALKLSEEIDFLKGLAKSNIDIAGGYLDYYDLDNAKKYYEKGNEYAEKLIKQDSSKANLTIWCRGLYNLGVVYGVEGNFEKEIELALLTIPVAEKMGDKMFVANCNANLAVRHNNLNNHEEAYRLFMISQKQYEEIGGPEDLLFHSLAFASCLYSLDSLPRMKKILEIAKENLDKTPNSIYYPQYFSELGLYYGGIGEYEKAIASLDIAYKYYDPHSKSENLRNLYQRYAAIYENMGAPEKAIEYTLMYMNFGGKIYENRIIANSNFELAKHEAKLNNFEKAYHHLKTYVSARDSLGVYTLVANMKNLESQYEIATKETEILFLQNEKNESALSLEKKKSQAYLLGGITSILALSLFSGYYFYNRKLSKANEKERLQEIEMQQLKQEQQNNIFSAMIDGQEKERKRLAIDLHDGLGGRLSGISMSLSKLDKDEPKEYPKKQLQKVMKDIDDSLTELRNVARNLMPETLVKFGLESALKDYCSNMTSNDTKVTLQYYGSEIDINISNQVMIYRVIQELINNAIKHANSSEVLVQYVCEGNNVNITVEDNGTGFDNSKQLTQKDTGMGLSNLQTRVAYLNGNIDFESKKNEGTTVTVNLDINAT